MDDNYGCASIIVLIALLFMIMFGVNSCSESDWNNGECPNCETRYELRGASKGLKYYACPDCGKEVERY
jgi:PHP family Zn ribbon phosphoesterase